MGQVIIRGGILVHRKNENALGLECNGFWDLPYFAARILIRGFHLDSIPPRRLSLGSMEGV